MTIWRVLVAVDAESPAAAAEHVARRLDGRRAKPGTSCVVKVLDFDGETAWKPAGPSKPRRRAR